MLDDTAFDKVAESAAGGGMNAGASERAPDSTFLHPVSSCFRAERAVEDVKARGVAVFDHFLGANAAAATRDAAEDLARLGVLRKARMGKNSTQWTDTRARGDDMVWFSDLLALSDAQVAPGMPSAAPAGPTLKNGGDAKAPDPVNGSIAQIGKAVEKLKQAADEMSDAIGKQFQSSAMTFQLARYADGARYVRHSDVGPQTPDRRLTVIYYMNQHWQQDHGGVLRLYLPVRSRSQSSIEPFDVAPLFDRLLVFRSEIEHEVLPSAAPRLALSGWIYRWHTPT